VKRTKQSYKGALHARLQVVVVDKDDPSRQLAAEESIYFRQEIVKLLDKEPDSPTPPWFSESGLVQEALRVTCADQCSLDWLLEKAESIPARTGCAFIVMKATDRPKQTKVRVWIPGPASEPKVLAEGFDLGTVCSVMQTILSMVQKWCKRHDLSVNPTKTEMVSCTRKRRFKNLRAPRFFGKELSLSHQVKYLGVILDSKQTWKPHLDRKCNKAIAVF